MRLDPRLLLFLLPALGCTGGETGIRGRILEAVTLDPLAGVDVSVGSDVAGWQLATTADDGSYELLDYDPEIARMRLDGRSVTGEGGHYPLVTTQVHEDWLVPGQVTPLPDKFLPRIDESTATDFGPVLIDSTDPDHPASDGWRQIDPAADAVRVVSRDAEVPGAMNPAGQPIRASVYAVFHPGTFVRFPDDASPVVTVTQVPVNQLPHQLPAYVSPMMMVTFQPSGTLVDPPADLHFGDIRGYSAAFAADMPKFAVWSLSHSLALFLELGEASLRANGPFGPELQTVDGVGLKELGWHGPVCTDVNFYATVRMSYEPNDSVQPPSGVLSMRVIGGGAGQNIDLWVSNQGGAIQTGTISSCGGFFEFRYTPSQGSPIEYAVPDWRCARNGGHNDIGSVTIDLSTSTPRMYVDVNLSSC